MLIGFTAASAAYLNSEKALADAQRVAHVGSWHWDAISDKVWWSDELYRVYEKAQGSLLPSYEDDQKNYTPDSAAQLTAVVQNAIRTGESYEIDLERDTETGNRSWVHAIGEAICDTDGVIVGLRGTVQDITERKQAEKLACVYMEEVQDLYNNAPCGYHSLDENGIFIRINNTELQWLGYQREELIGILSFEDVITPDSVGAFRANFPKFIVQGAHSNVEYEMVRKDGSRFPIIVNAGSVQDDAGRFLMSRSMVFDNTMNKKSEKALKQHAGRLIVLEEDLRKKIASDLHDDIAQTLTALSLNLAHIGNHLKSESREDFHETVANSRQLTKDISRSVRNLMVELHPHQLEEFGLVTAIRSHVEQFTKRTGLGVELNSKGNFPRLTGKKETALFRITQEALQNIMKHAVATKVTISLSNSGGVVRLTVTDDGKGFVPKAASPSPTGSGWGLTNMRERAELVGGSFQIHSIVGKGTTVEVEIKGAR